jgi:hypothetical protein
MLSFEWQNMGDLARRSYADYAARLGLYQEPDSSGIVSHVRMPEEHPDAAARFARIFEATGEQAEVVLPRLPIIERRSFGRTAAQVSQRALS